jgi:hypothetical protein
LGVTNSGGSTTFTVTDSIAEYVTYTARDTTDSLTIGTATVTFGTPPAVAASSTIFATPSTVPDDGTTPATITVFLRDSNRKGVPGRTVILSASPGHAVLDPTFAVTDVNGEATFQVTDTAPEQVTFTATDATDDLKLSAAQVTFQGGAGASPTTSVSWVTNAPSGPFSSGQVIEVTVAANSTFASGVGIYIEECAAPGGAVPTAPSQCDAKSVQTQPWFTNSDGSASYANYAVYALPDLATLSESTSSGPSCNLSNECVLYVGENPTNFSLPHLWSLPFAVNPGNGTDNGADPGNGLPEVPFTLALPVLAVAIIGGTILVRRRRSTTKTA